MASLGPSPVMPQYVTYTKHSGNRSSVALGTITSGANVESYSSAAADRDNPYPPQHRSRSPFGSMPWPVKTPASTDYMEVALLDTFGRDNPWPSRGSPITTAGYGTK